MYIIHYIHVNNLFITKKTPCRVESCDLQSGLILGGLDVCIIFSCVNDPLVIISVIAKGDAREELDFKIAVILINAPYSFN